MSNRIRKINQLDSLRALAAFSIVIYHFLPEYNLGKLPFGHIGVDVFFVISGYLITAILLEQKSAIGNKLQIIRNFIIKRALRLFPAYYLFVSFFAILMLALGLYVWDAGNGIYYFTYTQNILFFNEGMKGVQANHLWTLAIEEQFYLVWPWLVIYLSNTRLIRLLCVSVPLVLIFKSIPTNEKYAMLPFYHIDTLGSGSLLALLLKERGD
ncbi:MAG: acyltransferase family protein, partial [Flavobacteriales bacterium]